MPKWLKRVREIAARNPDALPKWMRHASAEKTWYRVSWQTEAGVGAEDAARPVVMMLDWLCRRGLLTRAGMATLKSAQGGALGSLVLASSMVAPKGAAFLDAYWDSWWESHGINLSIGAECSDAALAAIEQCWAAFGTDGNPGKQQLSRGTDRHGD